MPFTSIADALTAAQTTAGELADELNYAEANESDPAKLRALKRAHLLVAAAAELVEDAYGITGAPMSNPRPADGTPKS